MPSSFILDLNPLSGTVVAGEDSFVIEDATDLSQTFRLKVADLIVALSRLSPGGTGTVTSVNASGGSTGMAFSGGPITTSGTLTLSGTLATSSGGTGQTSAAAAFNALAPAQAGQSGKFLSSDGTNSFWATVSAGGGGTGTVTAVGLSAPGEFSVTGSPITASGTLALAWQPAAAGVFLGGPAGASGTPTFRALALSDLPSLSSLYQPTDPDLTALAALGSTGLAVRTAADTWAQRALAAGSGISISNGDGVAGNPTITCTVTPGTGTVTSVNGSGGTTGLTLTGGPITVSGTLTLGGTLAIASGGTGQTAANTAFNALAPAQAGKAGQFLTTNGTDTSWAQSTTTTTGYWRFDATSTTMADPGSGKLRVNNATPSSATLLAISKTTDPGTDASQLLASLANGDQLYIQDQGDATKWIRYGVTGASTNNTTWFQVPVSYRSSAGTLPSNNTPLAVQFTLGAAPGGGGGSGTVTSVALT